MNVIRISKALKFLGGFVFASAMMSCQNAAFASSLFALGSIFGSNSILELTATGGIVPVSLPSSSFPISIQVDSSNNIFALDFGSSSIDKITPDGTISTFATIPRFGDGNGNSSGITLGSKMAIAPDGTLYVSAQTNGLGLIYAVSPSGSVSRYATAPFNVGLTTNDFSALAVSADGTLIATRRTGSTIISVGAGGQLQFNSTQTNIIEPILPPGGGGGLFSGIGRILSGSTSGFVNTIFGSTLAIDASGNIYTRDIDATGKPIITKIIPQSGGGSMIGGVFSSSFSPISAALSGVFGSSLAIDPLGNIYTTDIDASGQNVIGKIDPSTGTFSTVITQPLPPIVTPPIGGDPDPDPNFTLIAANLAPTSTPYTFSSLAFPVQSSTASPTAVPEPFTLIGTLIGGTVALRLRKKLRDPNT
jgi:hypothetical protein